MTTVTMPTHQMKRNYNCLVLPISQCCRFVCVCATGLYLYYNVYFYDLASPAKMYLRLMVTEDRFTIVH